MQFKTRKKTFLKDTNNTTNIMYTILIILVLFLILSIFKNGIFPFIKGYGNLYTVVKPLIFTIISSITCLFTEYIYYLIIKKKQTIYDLFTKSFAIIPGVFLSLIISINTPIWLLVIGSMVASLSKVLLGGFGKNILNPALVGALVISIIFSSYIGGYLTEYEVDTISSATPLSKLTADSYLVTYDNLVKPYGTLWDFFIGNIPGSIGETFSLLLIITFIYLTYKGYIKSRITISYVATVALISLIICLNKDIGCWFILFNILSGGLLFGAVLMATDPVTSPITSKGQLLGGIILGILTMLIRYMTHFPEGVLISILIFNILTIGINYLSSILYNKKIVQNIILIIFIILIIPVSLTISSKIITKPLDDSYKIESKKELKGQTIYTVSGRGYAGNGSIKLEITFQKDKITNITILRSDDTFTDSIYKNNYLEKIKNNQEDLSSLDTISGCTYTSKYLKEIVTKTIEDYKQ